MAKRSGLMVLLAFVMAGIGGWGVARLPTAFIPNEDQGYMVVGLQLPDGASLEAHRCGAGPGERHRAGDARREAGRGDLRHIGARQQLRAGQCGVAYVILGRLSVRGKKEGQDLRSIVMHIGREVQVLQDGRAFPLVPPAIQGIGNAAASKMQIEQKDGSYDFVKLQNATANVIEQASTQSALANLVTSFRAGARTSGSMSTAPRRKP